MKTNTTTWILAIMACAALAVLTGCPGPDTAGSPGDALPAAGPAYTGKYTLSGNAGSGEVVFELDSAGSARAAVDSNKLSGKLKDPSGVRQLRGIYNPASGAFNLSADGSGLRHGITGTFGTDGKVLAANALVYNKSKTDRTSLAAFPVAQHSGPIGSGDGAAMLNSLPSEFVDNWSGSVAPSVGGDGWTGVHNYELKFSPYFMDYTETYTRTKSSNGKVERELQLRWTLVEIIDPSPEGIGVNAIFVIPGLSTALEANGKNAVDTAFQSYLDSKGIRAERVSAAADNPTWATSDSTEEYFIDDQGDVHCHNFTVDDKWLIDLSNLRDKNPASTYVKTRFWIDNNGKLNAVDYTSDGTNSFNNLAAARGATTWAPNPTSPLFTRQ